MASNPAHPANLSSLADELKLTAEEVRQLLNVACISVSENGTISSHDSERIKVLIKLLRVQPENRISPSVVAIENDHPIKSENLRKHRIELINVFTAAAAALAAAAAVWVARGELNRAVNSFQLGNSYMFENDFINAVDDFLSGKPAGSLVVIDARIGLGKSINEGEGFPSGYWPEYREKLCLAIQKSICPTEHGEPSFLDEPTAYLDRISDFNNIISMCYIDVKPDDDLCEVGISQ